MKISIPDAQSFPAEAFDLQRQYAAHLLLLRGVVGGTLPLAPAADSFDLTETCVAVGQATYVDTFASPPLLAYVDDIVATIIAARDPANGRTAISIEAPRGTRGGPVRLVWSNKTLISRQPLWIAGEKLEVRQQEAAPGGDLVIGLFHERPVEVHIGMKQLPAESITWENHLLQVRVPADVAPGIVLVVTQNRVYRSATPFSPAQRKKGA